MPRIPTGNFGFSSPTSAPPIQRASAAPLIDAIGQIAVQRDEQQKLLNRAKAANAEINYRQAVADKATDIKDRIARGELNYDQAHATFTEELQDIEAPAAEGLDEITAENLNSRVQQTQQTGLRAMDGIVDSARREDFKNQFSINLDLLAKDAGQPGADIDVINAKASAFAPLARAAGVPQHEVDQALQGFKDKNWLNQATQRAMQSRQDMEGLKSLEHDLVAEDGFYAGKLDTDKRNGVLNAVISHRIQLENAVERAAAKHETRGERALAQMDRQIASGVPATADMWAEWSKDVSGTPAEAEFSQRLNDEREVQQVLRLPIDQQLTFVQNKEAALKNGGGSIAQAQNVSRLRTAVTQNVQLLQQAPLVFNEQRTGMDTPPIELKQLLQPNGTDQIAEQLNERAVTLNAMRKNYGNAVPLSPLLPQEVEMMSAVLKDATPDESAQFFGALYQASGAPDIYKGAMQQLFPDSPVKALAGMLASKPVDITIEKNLFRADVTQSAPKVAATLLEGERLLNPSKSDKGSDGTPKRALYLPETKSLQNAFQDQVGNAFAGRPSAAQNAFQAVQAYYVGKASQTGRLASESSDIDSGIVREAVTSVLGSAVDYNGHGTVFAPWGMDRATFEDRVEQSFAQEIKRHGMTDNLNSMLPMLGLRNNGDGTYYLVQGRNYISDAKGAPIIINVNEPKP
jgi:hypothetical protein